MFLELRPPDLVELMDFLREETRAGRRQRRRPCSSSRARCKASRSMKRVTRSAARWPAAAVWGPSRCRRCSKRSGCWSIAAASSNTSPTARRSRRGRRSRRPQEMAAGAAQAVSDARQPERRDRAQGPSHDGHSGLRQEPVRQGHRLLLRAAALPRRHDRDLFRPARQARRRVRRKPAG